MKILNLKEPVYRGILILKWVFHKWYLLIISHSSVFFSGQFCRWIGTIISYTGFFSIFCFRIHVYWWWSEKSVCYIRMRWNSSCKLTDELNVIRGFPINWWAKILQQTECRNLVGSWNFLIAAFKRYTRLAKCGCIQTKLCKTFKLKKLNTVNYRV